MEPRTSKQFRHPLTHAAYIYRCHYMGKTFMQLVNHAPYLHRIYTATQLKTCIYGTLSKVSDGQTNSLKNLYSLPI